MKDLITSVLLLLIFTVVLGGVYPVVVWGIGQLAFPKQANGSLIINAQGDVMGSELIGQTFSSPEYFRGRPSAAGIGYDAVASSGSNLGPTSQKLINRIKTDTALLSSENPGKPVPADLVTASASGLDPHISPAAAEFQIARIAHERHVSEDDLRRTVADLTESRQFGILGEPRVNVLKLNLELNRRFGRP